MAFTIDSTTGLQVSPPLAVAQGGTGTATSRPLVQVQTFQTGVVATGTTVIPIDNTVPQNTEGDQYMSLSVTPTNAASTLEIDVVFFASNSVTGYYMIAALFQDSAVNALAAGVQYSGVAGGMVEVSFKHTMTAGTTSATTFKVRGGGHAAGTTTFNGNAAAQYLGGVLASRITIKEYLP